MKSYFDVEIKHIVNELLAIFDFNVFDIFYLGEVEKNKMSFSSCFYFRKNEQGELKDSYSLVKENNITEQDYEEHIDRINSALVGLFDAFVEDGQSPWDAVEVFYHNGKVTGKLKYGWFDNDYTPIERRIIWAYESLGLMPEVNSYSARLLNKYIENKGSANQ